MWTFMIKSNFLFVLVNYTQNIDLNADCYCSDLDFLKFCFSS